MKIIHIEGGLGNQMACYAVYVAASQSNPQDDFYIDTYLYDIKEAHSTISMWNGYELNKVFGVDIPDIRTLYTKEQVNEQIDYLRESEFWKHGWNYAEVFIQMMSKYDIELNNAVIREEDRNKGVKGTLKKKIKSIITKASSNHLLYICKHIAFIVYNKTSSDCGRYLYENRPGDYFYNITLDFMKSKFLYDKIGDLVRRGLTFSEPEDQKNHDYLQLVRSCNSVSVHVRRTDYLKFNEDCYKFGYFEQCINHIKKHVTNPTFFIFSDDLEWCRGNLDIIGMSQEDKVYFVGMNFGRNSYRDMQIMANCKHNIATKSSFGWWGSFLNCTPNKITCCQIGSYVVTNQF